MPHRVASFLRPVSGAFPHVKELRSRDVSADSSDTEDHPHGPIVKAQDLAATLKKHKRLSLPFGKTSGKEQHYGFFHHHHHHFSTPAPSAVTIDWSIESPPIVFHGTPDNSTGALVSGLMFLDVQQDQIEVDAFRATLKVHTKQKRPFQASCVGCQHQYENIEAWEFLAEPITLAKGRHHYPFSVLLPGNLPATVDAPLVSVAYEFKAELHLASEPRTPVPPMKFERTLDVKRSVPVPETPHHSIRVFPPTNIKTTAEYSTVLYTKSTNKMTLKLDGLTSASNEPKMVDVWKLKKLSWKLEETIKTKAPACKMHRPRAGEGEPEEAQKVHTRTEVRTLGEKHLLDGWKADYNSQGGNVEMEFDYAIQKQKPNGKDQKYLCDVKSGEVEVSHSLLIELIVSKEHATEGKAQWATPTGTGRILRMHYNCVVTEYPGLGVSWDNETPPTYENVPPSPPTYSNVVPDYFDMPGSPALSGQTTELLDADVLRSELRAWSSSGSAGTSGASTPISTPSRASTPALTP
jgi:hypothetical protein